MYHKFSRAECSVPAGLWLPHLETGDTARFSVFQAARHRRTRRALIKEIFGPLLYGMASTERFVPAGTNQPLAPFSRLMHVVQGICGPPGPSCFFLCYTSRVVHGTNLPTPKVPAISNPPSSTSNMAETIVPLLTSSAASHGEIPRSEVHAM